MKKATITIICLISILINISFTKINNEWGNWSVVSSSYNGIEARVKQGDYNEYAQKYHWEIQFRNKYTKNVIFNYDLTARTELYNCNPNKRKDLEAGETSDVTAFLINDNIKVHVCIGNVKFGE